MAAAVLAGAGGCGAPALEDDRQVRAELQQLLDRRAGAVTDGDEDEYLGAVAAGSTGYRKAQRRVLRNLRRLTLDEWTYRVTSVSRPPAGRDGRERAEARVELRYRIRGYDRSPVVAREQFGFVRSAGGWRIASELSDSAQQLWEQGRLTVVRSDHSLVLGAGTSPSRLRALARNAERAVAAVSRSRPEKWPRRVVVEAPATLRQTARLLDAPASDYRDIAAVTTGEAGTSGQAPADRIVVNPEAYGELSATGRQVVLTHETVHVATRTDTGDATPLWLSEGTADRIGYQGSGRTPRQVAPELAQAVRDGKPPRELPPDAEFRFGGDPEGMGRAYAGGWLACRLIARDWGEERLTEFYQRVGGSRKSSRAAVDEALRDVLGLDREAFVQRWRDYVRRQLS